MNTLIRRGTELAIAAVVVGAIIVALTAEYFQKGYDHDGPN